MPADDAHAIITLAWDALHRQDFAGARALWSEVRALLPDHPVGYLGNALTHRQAGHLDEAEAILRGLIVRFPDESGPIVEYAVTALQRHDWQAALERSTTARSRFPDMAIIYGGEIQALRELGRLPDAEALAAAAAAQFPDDPRVLIEHALLARLSHNWPAATTRWDAVRRILPDAPVGYLHGAVALRGNLRHADAEALLADAMKRFPDDREIMVEYAWAAHTQNRYDDAARRFQLVRTRYPDDPTGWLHGSGALRAQSAFDQADGLLREAIDRFPTEPRFMLDYATIKMAPQRRHDQDWPEAIRRVERMLQTHPSYQAGVIAAIGLLRDAEQPTRAEALSQTAIARFPDNAEIALLHAEAAERRGDRQEANVRYRAAKQRFPTVPDADIGLARGLASEDRFAEAEALLVATMAAFPAASAVADAYADLAARQEHWAEAAMRWTDAHTRFPTDSAFAQRAFEARMRIPETVIDASTPLVLADHADSDPRDLAMRFESLGGIGVGCEFGIFQRHCGAEPLGLLRWSEISLDMLMLVLRTRCDGIGSAATTELVLDMQQSGRREYCTLDRRGTMRMHTFIYEDQTTTERMYISVLKRLRFLSGKLVDDLTSGDKVFVYQLGGQAVSRDQIIELGRAVRTYGDTKLLCVCLADADHPAGGVETISAGLMVGYIDRFMHSPDGQHAASPSASWMTICRNALALLRAVPPAPNNVVSDPDGMARIMMQFESLGGSGHGCEFGLVQREFGVEPMGLLRWADLAFEYLVAGLASEFDGVGDEVNTIVFVPDGNALYWSRDTRFWMAQGSSIQVAETPIEAATAQICMRLRFLRAKLCDDLRDGRKIFVYKNNHHTLTNEELARLHAAVRRYGNTTLLYVRLEDASLANGSVAWAAPGLMIGAIDHFTHSPADDYLGSSTDSWAAICRAAHALATTLTSSPR